MEDVFDSQLLCPTLHDVRVLSGYNTDWDGEVFAKEDSGTVAGTKFLPLVARLVVIHPRIGPYTIDVGDNQFWKQLFDHYSELRDVLRINNFIGRDCSQGLFANYIFQFVPFEAITWRKQM